MFISNLSFCCFRDFLNFVSPQSLIQMMCCKTFVFLFMNYCVQWADVSSLELLQTLILGAKNPFVFIFTYRPVEYNHPFSQLIQELEHTRVSMTEILLKNLRKDSVRDLVANILSIDCRNNNHVKDLIHDDCDATGDNRNCASLANITDAICNITNGNPFFVRQQIIFWVDHGLISIDANQRWVWDIDKIKKCSVVGDMISTISEKIKKLPSLTQHALTVSLTFAFVLLCGFIQSMIFSHNDHGLFYFYHPFFINGDAIFL